MDAKHVHSWRLIEYDGPNARWECLCGAACYTAIGGRPA